MEMKGRPAGIERRQFLATSGGGLLAAAIPGSATTAGVVETSSASPGSYAMSSLQSATGSPRKIPIGVFDPVYNDLSIDEMLDRLIALGLQALKISTGG